MMVVMKKEIGVEIKKGIAEKEDLEDHISDLQPDLDLKKVPEVPWS